MKILISWSLLWYFGCLEFTISQCFLRNKNINWAFSFKTFMKLFNCFKLLNSSYLDISDVFCGVTVLIWFCCYVTSHKICDGLSSDCIPGAIS